MDPVNIAIALVILGGLLFVLWYGTSNRTKVAIPKPGEKRATDHADQKLRDKFARRVTAAYREQSITTAYDASTFALRHVNGGHQSLTEAYERWKTAKDDEADQIVLDQAGLGLVEDLSSWSELSSRILPRVTTRVAVERARLEQIVAQEEPAPFLPFGVMMALEFVIPTGRDGVQPIRLDPNSWGVGPQEVYQAAINNFVRLVDISFETPQAGVLKAVIGRGLESNISLLPGIFAPEGQAPMDGQPVFLILGHDTALMASSEDEDGLRYLIEQAQACVSGGDWLALRPQVMGAQGLEPLELPAEHPLAASIDALRTFDHHVAYDKSQQLVEQLEARRENGAAVSSIRREEHADGTAYTSTEWPAHPALLPVADRVRVTPEGEDEAVDVAWIDLIMMLGERGPSLEEGVYPPRARTTGPFPSDLAEKLREARITA